jgi:hypothetical protein
MNRPTWWRKGAIASLLVAGVASGCGSSAVPDSVVQVQAQWLCDVTRYAYADAAGMTQRLDELLAEAGISEDAYAEFEVQIDRDASVRSRVTAAYDDTCGAT